MCLVGATAKSVRRGVSTHGFKKSSSSGLVRGAIGVGNVFCCSQCGLGSCCEVEVDTAGLEDSNVSAGPCVASHDRVFAHC